MEHILKDCDKKKSLRHRETQAEYLDRIIDSFDGFILSGAHQVHGILNCRRQGSTSCVEVRRPAPWLVARCQLRAQSWSDV